VWDPGLSGFGMRTAGSALLMAMFVAGCARPVSHAPPPRIGPPSVRPARVQRLARWFDSNDPDRAAGSQQELVAASYLLAHLEQAGYLVNLDPVPVGNLLHSTNVIALPPSGAASTVVVVDFDTSASSPSDGPAIGTFLEVARALRVLHPHHSVEFAALGAEHIAVNGGEVGARSLVEVLKSQNLQPRIVRLGGVGEDQPDVEAAGPAADSIRSAAASLHVEVRTVGPAPTDVLTQAGFAESVIEGSLLAGPALFAHLARVTKE
jgi:hypothetical protein